MDAYPTSPLTDTPFRMEIIKNFDLTKVNTFHLKTLAKYYTEVNSVEQLKELLERFPDELPFILGGGSNILLTRNLDRLVIHNQMKGIEVVHEGDTEVLVRVAAGETWHTFVMYCVDKGYGGVENLSLIPGSAGAAPIQNIGAYGVELKDSFYELEALHLKEKYIRRMKLEECQFGYRESVFKHSLKGQFAVTSITLRLSKKPVLNVSYGAIERQLELMKVAKVTVKSVSDAVIAIRRSKLPDPADIGNAGSFFKNPVITKDEFIALQKMHPEIPHYPFDDRVKVPAAWLIESSGFRGFRRGNVGCYEKQPLVIVNYGGATGQEIFDFSEMIITKVRSDFQIQLQREVNVF